MKKQIKKTLSLMLAVLMVLSCWVWVAPEKAEAGLSGYSVEVDIQLDNPCSGGHISVTEISKNGTGSATTSNALESFRKASNSDLKGQLVTDFWWQCKFA